MGPGPGWRRLSLAIALGLTGLWLGAPGRARADGPALPIRDLPPFPQVISEEEKVIGVAVAGATDSEEETVSGASRREQSLGSVASAVTVISGDRLRRFGYRTLAEALSAVVGLYIVDDRMVDRLGIRGVQLLGDANTRILVLIDGSPINEPWSQFVDTGAALPVNLDDVARVEVIRGPVSSIYGTNAFVGIINVVTLDADKAPRVYGRSGFASFGSVNGNAGFNHGSLNRQTRGTLSWTYSDGESLAYPEFAEVPGAAPATDADALSALSGSLSFSYGRLFFHMRGYDRRRELPGAPYNATPGSTGNTVHDRHVLGELGYNYSFSDTISVAARLYVDAYRFDGALDYGEGRDFSTTGNSLWYGGELRGLWDLLPHGKLNLTAGLATELSDISYESSGVVEDVNMVPVAQAFSEDTTFDILGVYAEISSSPLPWLAVTAGERFDSNSLFDNRRSPRGALFLRKGEDYGLKLLYAEGFRNPSVFEAFYRDGVRFIAPGDDLRSETITSYEAVLWGRPLPGVNLRLSGWQWDLNDLIEKRAVSNSPPPPPAPQIVGKRLQFQNVGGNLRSRGVEAEATYRDTRGWLGFASVSYADVSRYDGAEDSPNAPALVAGLGASTPLLVSRFHLSTEVSYVGSRHTRDDRAGAVDTDAFVRWNLVAYAPSISGFDVTLGVRNILGIREQVPAQVDYDRQVVPAPGLPAMDVKMFTVPGAGREIFARVGYRF